jgi:hypothetical protein
LVLKDLKTLEGNTTGHSTVEEGEGGEGGKESLQHPPAPNSVILQKCYNKLIIQGVRGMQWHSWLRHCATNWKVAGSIPNGVTGIFQ